MAEAQAGGAFVVALMFQAVAANLIVLVVSLAKDLGMWRSQSY